MRRSADQPEPERVPAPTAMVRRSVVRVRPDVAARLRGGHPWVFREAMDRVPSGGSGTEVEVRDEAGDLVARGLYDAQSPVAIRVFTTHPERRIDASLIDERIAAAARLRSRFPELPGAAPPG